MFSGIYQILHTPFDGQGDIDWASYQRQIEYCLAAGVHGLVVPAMASEFFSLSDRERFDSVEFVLEGVNRRVPVLVGVQGVGWQAAVAFGEHAARRGADGLMAMPPYLRKASKADILTYYTKLASLGLPVMIQNAPALTGAALSPGELVSILRADSRITYVKEEAPPILQRITEVLSLAGEACDGVFGGANGLYLIDELERGACGNMPAGGLVDVQVKIFDHCAAGDCAGAEAIHRRLLPLLNYASLYGITFHKYVLWRRGVIASPFARDPQRVDLDEADRRTIERRWTLIESDVMEAYPWR